MERSILFYILLGAAVVTIPAMIERLLKDRVNYGWRFVISLFATVATAVLLVVVARPLGL